MARRAVRGMTFVDDDRLLDDGLQIGASIGEYLSETWSTQLTGYTSVFDYLTARGVDPARLNAVGFGQRKPIADNATAEGRQPNRRVMLIRTDPDM